MCFATADAATFCEGVQVRRGLLDGEQLRSSYGWVVQDLADEVECERADVEDVWRRAADQRGAHLEARHRRDALTPYTRLEESDRDGLEAPDGHGMGRGG